jgi:hypothetical protein
VGLNVIECGYIIGVLYTTTYGAPAEIAVPPIDGEIVIPVAEDLTVIEYHVVILAGSVDPKPITIPTIDAVKLVPVPVTAVVVTCTVPTVSTTSCIGKVLATGNGPTYLSSAVLPVFCIIKDPRLVLVESYDEIGVVDPVNLCFTALYGILVLC